MNNQQYKESMQGADSHVYTLKDNRGAANFHFGTPYYCHTAAVYEEWRIQDLATAKCESGNTNFVVRDRFATRLSKYVSRFHGRVRNFLLTCMPFYF